MKEIFTPIIVWKNGIKYDFTGYYEISNNGRIKSLGKIDALGHKRKEHIMRTYINNSGYESVMLSQNGKRKTFSVSRIEYESFNGRIPDGMQCNHINEIKTDNRLENLNLMTAKENINWGTRNKRAKEKISKAMAGKKKPQQCKPILQFDKNGLFLKRYDGASCVDFGNSSNITACCNGRIPSAYGYKWKYEK